MLDGAGADGGHPALWPGRPGATAAAAGGGTAGHQPELYIPPPLM